MQWLTIIRAVLSLLPLIIEAVKAIEAAFPQSGAGAAKSAAIRSTLESAYKVASDASVAFDALWPAIQTAINAVVGVANSTGAFRK